MALVDERDIPVTTRDRKLLACDWRPVATEEIDGEGEGDGGGLICTGGLLLSRDSRGGRGGKSRMTR